MGKNSRGSGRGEEQQTGPVYVLRQMVEKSTGDTGQYLNLGFVDLDKLLTLYRGLPMQIDGDGDATVDGK